MFSDPRRLAIALAGVCCFINLYATQPLLPLFGREFGATSAAVSMSVSAITLAVALVAPFMVALVVLSMALLAARYWRGEAGSRA